MKGSIILWLYHEVFDVSEKVAKVDVEEVPRCGDHDVVIVSVSYPLWVT